MKNNCVNKHIRRRAAFPLWATATNIGNPNFMLSTPNKT